MDAPLHRDRGLVGPPAPGRDLWLAVYDRLAGAIPDLTLSAYFSAVTYTTTGYGDVVLREEWRLVGGIEALTGILMCGWSTGDLLRGPEPHAQGVSDTICPDPGSA